MAAGRRAARFLPAHEKPAPDGGAGFGGVGGLQLVRRFKLCHGRLVLVRAADQNPVADILDIAFRGTVALLEFLRIGLALVDVDLSQFLVD
jgi:hypothetical protein